MKKNIENKKVVVFGESPLYGTNLQDLRDQPAGSTGPTGFVIQCCPRIKTVGDLEPVLDSLNFFTVCAVQTGSQSAQMIQNPSART